MFIVMFSFSALDGPVGWVVNMFRDDSTRP